MTERPQEHKATYYFSDLRRDELVALANAGVDHIGMSAMMAIRGLLVDHESSSSHVPNQAAQEALKSAQESPQAVTLTPDEYQFITTFLKNLSAQPEESSHDSPRE